MKVNRNILLIEPDYKNKYPPIGLMKIATYHKRQGDHVRFFKGNVNELIQERRLVDAIKSLSRLDKRVNWELKSHLLKRYFKTRKRTDLKDFLQKVNSKRTDQIEELLSAIAYSKPKKFYDRIYVTTLFTFYWNITIKTIDQAKILAANKDDVLVGGVMASLLKSEIEERTGIKPISGLLDKPGILDSDNEWIVDDLPLDYSILDEIEYTYPTQSAFITFMTKGCTRKCAFCSVPKLEPTYKDKVPTLEKFQQSAEIYGEPRNLLLMDNNVLASPRFPEIVEEIKQMGFYKGAKYIEPNQLTIAYQRLKSVVNTEDVSIIKKMVTLLHQLHAERLKGLRKVEFGNLLKEYQLNDPKTATKRNLLRAYKYVAPVFEKYRNKAPSDRYVDFNQGIDGRYVNEDNMRLLSQLNVRPLRIAFDFIGMKKDYTRAVELAAKNGIRELSNYILYNFKDAPEDLYERLKINVDLNSELGLKIFSFPMKYIPLFGEEAKHRKHIGDKWSPKFIRAIQSILNTTKGIVAPGADFFHLAFGKDLEKYWELLYMPEAFIVYRSKFENAGLTEQWRNLYYSLDPNELKEAQTIIQKNDFKNVHDKSSNIKIIELLKHYTVDNSSVLSKVVDVKREKLKSAFNKLIRKDMFIDLTLTYDYDRTYRKAQKTLVEL